MNRERFKIIIRSRLKLSLISGLLAVFLATSGNFSFAGLTDDLQKDIDIKKAQIQELEKQVASLRENIKGTQSQQATLKKQVAMLEGEIRRLETEIRLTQAKISAANLEIQNLDIRIGEAQDKLTVNKTYLASAIRTIAEFDQEEPIEIILKNDNFSDMFNQMQNIESLQEAVQQRLNDIRSLKAQLEEQKTQQEKFKNSLQDLNEELRGKNLVLVFQKDDKQDLLIATKNQEKQYQSQLTELQKKQQEIQKEIFQLEDKLRMAINPNSIPGTSKGLFDWPLKSYITQTYGPTSQTGFINNVYNFHNGIDIGAPTGTAIKAPYDGTISGVGNDGKYAYGKWITINHHNGLTTLYGHLSIQKVSVGQAVKRGEIIGYSGSTGYSTGPHLHFTVYATDTFEIESRWYGALPVGGSINPMNYLE
jgi:murein DD-endopeptidase MepM/ murein hydrolase activator NlpD